MFFVGARTRLNFCHSPSVSPLRRLCDLCVNSFSSFPIFHFLVSPLGSSLLSQRDTLSSPPAREATMAYFALFYHVVDRFVERRAPFRESHLAHAQRATERGELAL